MSLRTSIVFRALVAALAVASAVSPGRGQTLDPRPLAAATWSEVRTQHFTIFTDAAQSAAGSIGRRLEDFASLLQALNPGLRVFPALPTDIYVFRSDAEMKDFTPRGVESIAGYSTNGPGRSLFVTSAEIESDERGRVICHEFTHLFVGANFADMPVWLNEGLAQYYETFRLRGGGRAEFGHELEGRAAWLDSHPLASLEVLFAMKTGARAYQLDNELRTTAYTEGWAIVHYLRSDRARSARFDSVLVGMRRGVAAPTAFRAQFPSDQWPALISSVHDYVHTGMLKNASVTLPATNVEDTRDRTLSEADALAALGDLALALSADSNATALYKAALEREPGHARAQAALGYIADRGDDSAQAEAGYVKALAGAGKDARVPLLAGLGTLERARRVYEAAHAPSDAYSDYVLAAQRRFKRCLELDPKQPEALGQLGITFLARGESPDEAVRALEAATEALPSYAGYRRALSDAREMRARGR